MNGERLGKPEPFAFNYSVVLGGHYHLKPMPRP